MEENVVFNTEHNGLKLGHNNSSSPAVQKCALKRLSPLWLHLNTTTFGFVFFINELLS